jgi:hypothetical protein
MFHGNPYDNVMIEAVHELDKGLKPGPKPLNLWRWISTMLRQRRAVSRLALPQNGYPQNLRVEEECA